MKRWEIQVASIPVPCWDCGQLTRLTQTEVQLCWACVCQALIKTGSGVGTHLSTTENTAERA